MGYADDYREHLTVSPMSDFVEQVGDLFERFGLCRDLGRILAALYLAPRPLARAELAELLGLSVAMAATSLEELSRWQAVRMAGEHYEAEPRLASVFAAVLSRRERKANARLRAVADEVRLAYAPSRQGEQLVARLKTLEGLFDLHEALVQKIEHALPSVAARHE